MYVHMLQATEERLRGKRAKTPNEEMDHFSSTFVLATDGLPSSIDPSSTSISSSLMTTPPLPSSAPSTITPTDTPKEISLPPTLQNPSPRVAYVALFGNMAVVVTATSSPLFPILLEMSPPVFPVELLNASSPLISSVDVNIPSTSHDTDSLPSFSFAMNTPTGADIPSPVISWFSPPPSASIS